MIARKPTLHDLPALALLIHAYSKEAAQGMAVPIDHETVVESLANIIQAQNYVTVVVCDEDKIVGVSFGFFGQTWWKEPCGAFDMFYIAQSHRGTKAARMLVGAMVEGFKENGCGWIYAAAENGMGLKNEKLFFNLFKKYNFCDIGSGRFILNLRGF
jgi:GNAT superfamily N-acetyltransferase